MDVGDLYKVEVDQSTAKDLLRIGGFLLLLDVPQGTVVGLDQQSSIVGPNFQGIKMIPPGPHLLHYNPVSKHNEVSATVSQYIYIKSKQVMVQKWDPQPELLIPIDDEDEVARYAMGVARMDFDLGLAPYNIHAYQSWKSLTNHIHAGLIDRLSPPGKNFSITAEASPPVNSQSQAEQNLNTQLADIHLRETNQEENGAASPTQNGSKNGITAGRCFYSNIPRNVKRKGLKAEELTALHMDKSPVLKDLIAKEYGGDEESLIGELQFAFTAFLCGQSLEGFAFWKEILNLLLGCEDYYLKGQNGAKFYTQILEAIEAQLACSLSDQSSQEVHSTPGNDLISMHMLDGILADSFLRQLFSQFFETLHESEGIVSASLLEASEKLQRTLRERLGWDFRITDWQDEDIDDEFKPTIVDL